MDRVADLKVDVVKFHFDDPPNAMTAETWGAIIDQAKGILMAQSGMTADEAFDLLRKGSQRENTKLRDIAQRIVERDGRPVQAIAAPEPFALAVAEVAESELDARLDAEARRPFDLSRDLPIRAALFRTAADAHVLVLTVHHVAVDGWSVGTLFRELSELYAARVEGRDAALPPVPLQYADFAAWQRGWLQGSALERQTAYWRRALDGAPSSIDLPADRPRPAEQSFRGALHTFAVPAQVAERVRALASAEQVTPFMATLAAFAALLGRYSGASDVVVGSQVVTQLGHGQEPELAAWAGVDGGAHGPIVSPAPAAGKFGCAPALIASHPGRRRSGG